MVMEKAEMESDIISWLFSALGFAVKKLSLPMSALGAVWGQIPSHLQKNIITEAHRISNRIVTLRDITLPMMKTTDDLGNFSFELSMRLESKLGTDIKNEVKTFNEMVKKECIEFGLPGIIYLYLLEEIKGSNNDIIEQIEEKNDYVMQSQSSDIDSWFVGNWERFAPYFKA